LVVDDFGEEEEKAIVSNEELPEKREGEKKEDEKKEDVKKEGFKKEGFKNPEKNITGTSFGRSIEDKFKLSLLQIEKRFIDLETAVNEMQQRVSAIDPSAVADLSERMEDVEDLLMVEQAGIVELKKMLEEMQAYMQKETLEEKPSITQEEVKQWIQPMMQPMMQPVLQSIESRLHERISSIEKRLQSLATMPQEGAHPDEVAGLRARIDALQSKLSILENMKAEIEVLRNKIEPLNAETLKSIVNEISDLRIETSREIREIKEKVGNAPLYADIQFLSNRVKDLKLSMDNLLNMKVEIDSKILNIERAMAEGGGGTATSSAVLIEEVESARKDLISHSKKLSSIEHMIHDITSKIEALHGGEFDEKLKKFKEMEELYKKLEATYGDLERKIMDIGRTMPHRVQEDVGNIKADVGNLHDEVKQLRAEMQHAVSRMQGQSVSKIAEQMEGVRKRIADLEDNIQSLHEAARIAPAATTLYDEQINELLQRIVLLESRLAAMEQLLERRPPTTYRDISQRPIILE